MERLVTVDDAAAFRARVEPFLRAHEAENNLLFGILRGVERGRYGDARLCFLEDGGDVTAVAIRTPPNNVVLSWASIEATRALASLIEPSVPGVSSEAKQAAVFAEAWAARTRGSYSTSMRQRIYVLSHVEPPSAVPGAPRWAGEADRDLLVRWMDAFEREAIPADDPTAGHAARRVEAFLRDPDAGILIWTKDGLPVSIAGHSGPTPNGMRVGPVYTPPEQRGRGYASACVAELSARVLASGRRFCFLYTDLANPTSNSIYPRVGYRPVCDAAVYRFRAVGDASL